MRLHASLKSLALCGLLFVQTAHAAILSVDGAIQEITPNNSVAAGSAFESNGIANVFEELSNVTLTSALTRLNTAGTNVDGVLDIGTRVSSYYLFTDPEDSSNVGSVVTGPGSVTFDGEILAVIYRGAALNATDMFFALPQLTYRIQGGGNPGAGGFPNTDLWVINGNTLNLTRFTTNDSAYDAVRILVEAAPVPLPPALMLVFAPLLLSMRLRGRER